MVTEEYSDAGAAVLKQSDGKDLTQAQFDAIMDTWAYKEGKDTALVTTWDEMINSSSDSTFFEKVNIHVNSKTSVSNTLEKLLQTLEIERGVEQAVDSLLGDWTFREEPPTNEDIFFADYLNLHISNNGTISIENGNDYAGGYHWTGFYKYDSSRTLLTLYMHNEDWFEISEYTYRVNSQKDTLKITRITGKRISC